MLSTISFCEIGANIFSEPESQNYTPLGCVGRPRKSPASHTNLVSQMEGGMQVQIHSKEQRFCRLNFEEGEKLRLHAM